MGTTQRYCLKLVFVFGLGLNSWLAIAKSDESNRRPASEVPSGKLAQSKPVDLELWIRKLGSPIYRERQEAFLHLWELGQNDSSELREALDRASDATDLDVSISARWLKMLIRLASSPAEVSPLLKDLMLVRSGDSYTLLRLASNDQWEHLEKMLQIINPGERTRIFSELGTADQNLSKLLFLAWETQQQVRIPKLVDLIWPESQAVKSRLLWRDLRQLGLIDVPLEGLKSDESQTGLAQCVELELNNQHTQAIELAISLKEYRDATLLAVENANWPLAVKANDLRDRFNSQRASRLRLGATPQDVNLPEEPAPGSIQSGMAAISMARRSLLASWAGDEENSQRLAQAIGTPGPSEHDLAGHLTALPFCGRFEEAISIAKERSREQAYETLVSQGRIDEAVEVLGWKDWSVNSVREWLDEQLKKKPTKEGDNVEHTLVLASLGTLMNRLGERELANLIDEGLLHWNSGAGAEHGIRLDNGLELTLSEITRERWVVSMYVWAGQHRRDWALKQFKQLLREAIDDDHRRSILNQLYNLDQLSGSSKTGMAALHGLENEILEWFRDERSEQVRQKNASGDSAPLVEMAWGQAVEDLENFAHGREVLGWPEDWHRVGLGKLGAGLLKRVDAESRATISVQLARVALDLKRSDLARAWLFNDANDQFLEMVAKIEADGENLSLDESSANWERFEILSEIFKQKFEYRAAAKLLEKLVLQNPRRADLAMDCAWCLEQIGDTNRAQQIRLQALSIPMSSEEAQLYSSELEDRNFLGEAMLLLRHSLRVHDTASSKNYFACSNLASMGQNRIAEWLKQSNTDFHSHLPFLKLNALDNRRVWLSWLDNFPQKIVDLKYFLHFVECYWRAEARIAIANRDFESASTAIEKCFQANPDQIETPIELIPLGEIAFGKEKVHAWLDRYATPMEEHLSRWKDDTLIGNNLAWLYANIDQRLERAHELSKHVTELLPEDDVYLDTLAEVEFRLGNRDQAIKVSSKCRERAPLEIHHRNQIERFRRQSQKK
jgi:hypothetical protein